MADPAFIYIVSVLTVGAFLIGACLSWQLKDVYDTWVEKKDYTQAVLHTCLLYTSDAADES